MIPNEFFGLNESVSAERKDWKKVQVNFLPPELIYY